MFDYGNVPFGLDIVNFGSTFSKYGFDYKYFRAKGFNFATAPQSLETDRKVLEKYQRNINRNAIVVIAISPFGFCSSDNTATRPRFGHRYTSFVKNICKKAIRYGQHKSNRPRESPLTEAELVQKNANDRVDSWVRGFSLKNVVTQAPTPVLEKRFIKTRQTLSQIIALCNKCGFRPVIVTMPVAKEESSQFSERFIQEFCYDNIDQAECGDTPILDYFRDARFADYHLYENYADCLNDEGRKLFAHIFTEDLSRLELWEK